MSLSRLQTENRVLLFPDAPYGATLERGGSRVFFIASKIFWALVQPLSLVLLLTLIGWVLVLLGRRRLGLTAGALGLVALVVSGFTSFGYALIGPLEDRFVRPATMPESVSTIVMLGGATAGRVSTARLVPELNEAGDRMTATLYLARLYPEAKILISGGTGLLVADGESEAETGRRFFTEQGIAPERLLLEGASRNTDENAALTKQLLGADTGTIVLVTSAFHMPRSVGLFRKEGMEVVPWPTDYRSAGQEGFGIDMANPVTNIETTTVAVKEWIGLFAYHWTGRIADLLPAQTSN